MSKLLLLLFNLLFSEEWGMTITASDVEGVGASDYIALNMCEGCSNSFLYGEDEYNIPAPPGYYTDISFFREECLLGFIDENGFVCQSPYFYRDKRSFYDSSELVIWNIVGSTVLNNNANDIQFSWSFDDLSSDYEIYLYIGDYQNPTKYNMRATSSVELAQTQITLNELENPQIRVIVGGCASSGNISEYYYDNDGDGYGYGISMEFCTNQQPSGWVDNNSDSKDMNDIIIYLMTCIFVLLLVDYIFKMGKSSY